MIEGIQQKNISLDKGIVRTPSMGVEGELSECVNLIPHAGEMVRIHEPQLMGIELEAEAILKEIHETETYRSYLYWLGGSIYYRLVSKESGTAFNPTKLCTVPFDAKILGMGNSLIVYGEDINALWYLLKGTEYQEQSLVNSVFDINFSLDSDTYKVGGSLLYFLPSEKPLGKKTLVHKYEMETAKKYENIYYPFKAGKWYSLVYEPRGSGAITPSQTANYSRTLMGRIGYEDLNGDYHDILAREKTSDSDTNAPYRSLFHERVFQLSEDATLLSVAFYFPASLQGTWEDGLVEEGYQMSQTSVFGIFRIYEVEVDWGATKGYYIPPDQKDSVANALYGDLAFHATQIKEQYNSFIHPFFVRYGLRLITGDIAWVSAPILMEPNDFPPVIGIGDLKYNTDDIYASAFFAQPTLALWKSRLKYRVNINLDTLNLLKTQETLQEVVIAIAPPMYVYKQDVLPEDIYTFCIKNSYIAPTTYAYTGIESLSLEEETFIPLPRPDSTYEQRIAEQSSSSFNIVKEIKLSELIAQEWISLDLTKEDIQGIYDNTLEKLPVPFIPMGQQGPVAFGTAFEYNQRLSAANLRQQGFEGYSLDCMSGWISTSVCTGASYEVQLAAEGSLSQFTLQHKPGGASPIHTRFFFYPESRAKTVTIYSDGQKAEARLTLCPLLGGAFCLSPLFSETTEQGPTSNLVPELQHPNKIRLSQAGNPFIWVKDYYLPCRHILSISSATKALSQGQFGEFPLIAFCDNGIWALSVNEDGTFSAKHPISRDVLTNPNILQLDNALVFATERGMLLLSGSDINSFSDQLKGPSSTNGIISTDWDGVDFIEEIQKALFAYDYSLQLIHVFPPNVTYHYVYDLASGQWSTQILDKQLTAAVAGYPFSTMQFGRQLMQYNNELEKGIMRQGWLLTRPIAFDDIFTRKMLADIRLFGQKTTSDTSFKVQVYTSEDRVKWNRLTSLKSRSAKWYRFLIKVNMDGLDTLSGIACQYVPRFGHKLR